MSEVQDDYPWLLELGEVVNKPDVKAVFEVPDSETSRELHWQFGNIDLKPGEKIVVLVPQHMSGIVKDIVLGHHKRQEFWNLGPGERAEGHDPAGAYSKIRVLDMNDLVWKDWRDPQGYNPIKYAERRGDIEYENLHDWYGTVGEVRPVAIEITSCGKNPELSVVTECSLDLVTHPEVNEKTDTIESIYTAGTLFIDLVGGKNKVPSYGGGEYVGAYSDALPLPRANGKEHFEIGRSVNSDVEYLDNSGKLHIKLPVGVKILSLEVSIGDTWFNYYGDGKKQLGWSKLNSYLVKANGESDQFMNNVNIPPQGVLSGGFTDSEYITRDGDEIVIESRNTSYLMGWRITFDN